MARVINKGIDFSVRAFGMDIVQGTQYTCVLYQSAQLVGGRAEVTQSAVANTQGDGGECVFAFSEAQTAELREGKCILEIYETNGKSTMVYKDDFAIVRSTSLAR